MNLDKYLLDIARDRKYWDNKRTAIRQKEKKLEELLGRYEADAEQLREKRREIIAEARDEARRIIDGSNAEIERAIREIRESQADRERTLAARRELEQKRRHLDRDTTSERHPELRKAPRNKKKRDHDTTPVPAAKQQPVTVGCNVKLDGEGTPGKVLEVSGNQATVAFGMLKTTVKIDRLRVTDAAVKSGARASSFVSSATSDSLRERQLNFSRDIDVRGMRVDEALQAITYFIDDAVQFSADRVRILHGTGTGALRQAIRQYLDTVPGVRSYADEHVQFGGAGITVVDLA